MEQQIKEIYDIVTKSGVENFFTKYSAIIVGVIAFLGVLLQLIISYRTNKKNQRFQEIWEQNKIDADIISKSRIEWLGQARKFATEIQSESLEMLLTGVSVVELFYAIVSLEDNQQNLNDEDYKERKKTMKIELESVHNKFLNAKYKSIKAVNSFKLLFGTNPENDEIIKAAMDIIYKTYEMNELILKCNKNLNDLQRDLNKSKIIFSEGERAQNKFSNTCRRYFHKEWTKAKQGK